MSVNRRMFYPLPNDPLPQGTRCLQVTIPDSDEFENYLRGKLFELTKWFTYQRDSAHTGKKIADTFAAALQLDRPLRPCTPVAPIIGVDDDMPIFRQEGCALQTQCADGSWVTIYDPTACIAQLAGQQAPQNPTPPGGEQSVCLNVQANAPYALTVALDSGDRIETQSIQGAWTDDSGFFSYWYCGDGQHYFAIAGCAGGAATDPSDPLPSANHMAALLNLNGTYLDISKTGTVVVPPGITNQIATIVPNMHGATTPSGSIAICLKVTKAAGTFTLAYSWGTGPTSVTPGSTVTINSAFTGASDHISFTISPNAKVTILGATGFIWSGVNPALDYLAWTDAGGGSHGLPGGTGGSVQPTSFPAGTAIQFLAVDDDQPVSGHPFSIDVLFEAV